ncbi:hypothetical protein J0K78_04965 [Halobacillus sp. GSS1]|uniref:hypothetical protein n=1 Tax=Halobacillus sp. GSS1 TaxID=2815919 RepID=UPI001A8CE325|nr:hypothetical protein [Halobacillus sp. GSS1]MBN9653611.1 hypothetical protein [Halobacillus sp. GSS1]
MVVKKDKVVSVRLDSESYEKLTYIQEAMKEMTGSKPSNSDLFHQMISLYQTYINEVDQDVLQDVHRKALIKALAKTE